MAFSYKEYTNRDAGQREFTFAFDAVAKDTTNIKVTIGGKHLYDGVSKYNTTTRALDDTSGLVQDAEYTVSTGSITIKSDVSFTVGNATIASGVPTLSASVPLRIYRETNRNTAEVTFSSGSILADSDLNKANNQGRFLALEAVDRADESMSIDPDDSTQYDIQISGADKRIFGVDSPNNTNDAANKAYVDGVAMGSGANIVTTDGSQTLTAKTLTSPVLNTGVSGTAIKDEDDMSSDSASHLATQQSIKAYVDAQIATEDTIAELNDTTITGTPADNEVLAYDSSSSKWINQTASEAGLAASSDVLSLIDEDDMATDSATRPPSQQSVKAYADQLAFQGEPHIISGVLYPAVADKMLDGTTSLSASTTGPGGSTVASSKYGTVQSDGRMYYYTDIKGSKPIKDPRIGGHFGSQRHKLKSLQLLEQETATHGGDVFSVDGKEYFRVHTTSNSGGITMENDGSGVYLKSAYGYQTSIEIVGYFSGINLLGRSLTTSLVNQGLHYSLDGVALNSGAEQTDFETSVSSPLGSRYVDASSLVNAFSGQTLGIHTFTLREYATTEVLHFYGIELIAQDTTSTANRSKIQIPSQNVVSYGKKFTVSGTPHYDPFSAKTDGSAWTSPTSGTNNANSSASWPTNIDTSTSLGLDKWVDGSNYYRPYNGGRVVKWVDSSGTIKTSVTVMPPNAKSIADSSSLTNGTAKANASASNDTFYPTFEAHTTDVNEDNLHEVAKTFHFREFGNGSANGGTGSTYADASMLSTTQDDIAYVMDDGLTSLSCNDAAITGSSLYTEDTGERYITFIGTGISVNMKHSNSGNASDDHRVYIDGVELLEWDGTSNNTSNHWVHYAQNLPYGTHILKIDRLNAVSSVPADNEYSFHQPKRPPIPEDACVLADYMLMADFVAQTAETVGLISKGTRLVSSSRDHFYDASGVTFTNSLTIEVSNGWSVSCGALGSGNTATIKLPYFGTDFLMGHFANRKGTITENLNSDVGTYSNISTTTYSGLSKHTGNNLGLNEIRNHLVDGQNDDQLWHSHSQIATPIHTSSHYQSFETPFLHELVGGDRNMEQTNLVVSPDGKTWDELTRDTSYLASDIVLSATNNTTTSWYAVIILDEWRGQPLHGADTRAKECFNKDSWAIGYDRLICLKDGTYEMFTTGKFDSHQDIYINGVAAQLTPNSSHSGVKLIKHLNRGDYIQPSGDFGDNSDVRYSHFYIKKIN